MKEASSSGTGGSTSSGNAAPLPNFLGISSTPIPGSNNDHFDSD